MGAWFHYFLGTPQRAMRTFIAIVVIAVVAYPVILRTTVERLVAELGPVVSDLVGVLIQLFVIFLAYRILIAPILRRGK